MDFWNQVLFFFRNRLPVAHVPANETIFPAIVFSNERFAATVYPNAEERLGDE
jgi:hypothetical protein